MNRNIYQRPKTSPGSLDPFEVEGVRFRVTATRRVLLDERPIEWLSADGRIALTRNKGLTAYHAIVNGAPLKQKFRALHTAARMSVKHLRRATLPVAASR